MVNAISSNGSYKYEALKPTKLPNGFVAVQVHYKVHPLRQDPEWIKSVTQGMDASDIDKEWECKLLGGDGRLFPYDKLFDENNEPILTSMYSDPIPGRQYVIGADGAEGEGNPSCGVVLDGHSWDEVCHIHGKYDSRRFASILFDVGMRYNSALLGVENEKWGNITLTKLEDMHYPNLYYREKKRRVRDGRREKPVKKLGWETNGKTKIVMILDLVDAVTEGTIGIATFQTIQEMNNFLDDDGKFHGDSGCFDDRVMATAIALQLAKTISPSYIDLNEAAQFGDPLEMVSSSYFNLATSIHIPEYRQREDNNEFLTTAVDW